MNAKPPIFQEYLPGGIVFEMIEVQGGVFVMGNDDQNALFGEYPAHEVKLDTFRIGKVPVTQELWQAVAKENPTPSFFSGDLRPVESISWLDIQSFLDALNGMTKYEYRLPTEAEWEYAARGGHMSRGFTYSGGPYLPEVGWYHKNSHGETQEVGRKQPNELGVFDMSGNVWERCADWWDGKYYAECKKEGVVENPKGPEKRFIRIMRGGSWVNAPRSCRVSDRFLIRPG